MTTFIENIVIFIDNIINAITSSFGSYFTTFLNKSVFYETSLISISNIT